MKQNYELDYLLPSRTGEEDLAEKNRQITDLIQSENGQVVETTSPRRLVLAYPIKKENSAFFQTVSFWLEGPSAKELEKTLQKDKNVLRFLLVKRPAGGYTAKPRPRRPARLSETAGFPKTPARGAEGEKASPKVELQEIEKKLEEIFKDESQ